MPKTSLKKHSGKTKSEKTKTSTKVGQQLENVVSLPNVVSMLTFIKLQDEVDSLHKQQKETCEQAVRAILHALDCKDQYTFGHSMRVTFYALALGKEMGLNEEEMYTLELSALFHDIGKIAVPDSVLLKPSRLDDEEFLIMKQHPSKSAEILDGFGPFEEVAKYAKHHHERYDGRGYPDQLKGEQIPLFSRIILIADTFDAMTSTRPYREGLPYEVAFNELEEFAGSQFDAKLVKKFILAMAKEKSNGTTTFKLSIIDGEFKKDAA